MGSDRAIGLMLRTVAVLISCVAEICSVGVGNLGMAAIGSVYCFTLCDPCKMESSLRDEGMDLLNWLAVHSTDTPRHIARYKLHWHILTWS